MLTYSLYDRSKLVYVGVTSEPEMREKVHVLHGTKFTRLEVTSRKMSSEAALRRESKILADYAKKHAGRFPRDNHHVA
jgi:predicted GIY-YIG superfamily endonuclease